MLKEDPVDKADIWCMPQRYKHIRIPRMLRMAGPMYHSIGNGSILHPQRPVLTVSYLQGPKDTSTNFQKFQNSGADENNLIVHSSTYLSAFVRIKSASYPYLIHISTYN